MSLIEKLDGVLANWRAKTFGNQTWNDVMETCADELDALMPAIRQAMIDAERARAWRNRFISERTSTHQSSGMSYELARAHAEDDANTYEAAFDKARATGEGEGNG